MHWSAPKGRERAKSRVLIVESEYGVRESAVEALELDGHDVVGASNAIEAITALQADDFDVLVLDLGMHHLGGEELLSFVRAEGRRDDLAFVANELLEAIADSLDLPDLELSADVTDSLSDLPWASDVDELRDTLTRAATLAQGDMVDMALLTYARAISMS